MLPPLPPPGPDPGWFPDPLRRFELRYFNGSTWTADVASRGMRTVDLLPTSSVSVGYAPTATPFPRSAPGWSDRWLPSAPQLPSVTATVALVLSCAAIAIGWVPFLFFVGAVAAVAAAVFAVVALRRIKAGRERGKAAAWWAIALLPVAVGSVILGSWLTFRTVEEMENYLNPPPHQLHSMTCTANGDSITYSGMLTNTSKAPSDFTVAVRLESASGRQARRELLLRQVQPNEERAWSVTQDLLGGQVRCRIDAVYGPQPIVGK